MPTSRPLALAALLVALTATPAAARAAQAPAPVDPSPPAAAESPLPESLPVADPPAATPPTTPQETAPPPAESPATSPATAPAEPPQADRRRVRWYDVPATDLRRLSIAANLQVDLVGLAVGVRPEVLYRPFRATRGANLRFGFGLLPGPEYFFLPIDLGWRQHFVPHHRLTLELGAGYEQQVFLVRDAPVVTRGYFYTELGLAVRVISRGWLGVQVAPGWAPFSHPGPGLAVRLGFRWDFRGRADRASVSRRAADRAPT